MKIWIFSAFELIPSDGALPLRYGIMAEEFANRHHDVTFISSRFCHLLKNQRTQTSWTNDKKQTVNVPKLVLLDTTSYISHLGIKRVLSYYRVSQSLKKFLRQQNQETKPDLIICAYPLIDVAFLLSKYAKENAIFMVTDIQDVWPLNFRNVLPSVVFDFFTYRMKQKFKTVLQNSDVVTAVSQDYLQIAASIHKNALTNAFCLGSYPDSFKDLEHEKPHTLKKQAFYLGNASTNTILKKIIAVFKKTPNQKLLVAGLGKATDAYRTEVLNHSNISLKEWLNSEEIAKHSFESDYGLLIANPASIIALPYKAFTYWMAGLPVVNNIRNGEAEELIAKNKLGITVKEDTEAEYEKVINQMNSEFSLADRKRIQKFAKENFDVKQIISDYCSWILNLMEQKRDGKK